MMRERPAKNEEGFALVLVTILVIAFTLVATSLIDHRNATLLPDEQADTRAKLTRLSNAILQYYLLNTDPTTGKNYYPCPARQDLLESDNNFGLDTSCRTDTTGLTQLGATHENVRGMVPIRALLPYGAAPEDVFDSWGDRIMYVVNTNLTAGGSGTVTEHLSVTQQASGITYGTAGAPDFVVISYGRDKVGGIPRYRTGVTDACTAGSGSGPQANCDTDVTFVDAAPMTAASIGSASYFDDLLSYYRVATCPAQTLSWSAGGNICTGTIAAADDTTTTTVTNTDPAMTGQETATCTGTQWVFSAVACISNDVGCGTANNVATPSPPTSNLCSSGYTASAVTGTTTYTWTCSDGTRTSNCSAVSSGAANSCSGRAIWGNPTACSTALPSGTLANGDSAYVVADDPGSAYPPGFINHAIATCNNGTLTYANVVCQH